MFFPIDFFPDWLQGIAKALPFAYSAYWPAYTMVNFSRDVFLAGLKGQLIYIIALFAIVLLIFKRGEKRVHAQGG
jgi:ABC-2 type transport system permease protein